MLQAALCLLLQTCCYEWGRGREEGCGITVQWPLADCELPTFTYPSATHPLLPNLTALTSITQLQLLMLMLSLQNVELNTEGVKEQSLAELLKLVLHLFIVPVLQMVRSRSKGGKVERGKPRAVSTGTRNTTWYGQTPHQITSTLIHHCHSFAWDLIWVISKTQVCTSGALV